MLRIDKDIWPKKNINELVSWLKQHVDVEEVQIELLPKPSLDAIKYNILHGYASTNLKSESGFSKFLMFRLLDTEKNEIYNRSMAMCREEFIYVVFEQNSGMISSNCNQLQLELVLEQGISQEDFLKKSVAYRTYMSYLLFYKKHEY